MNIRPIMTTLLIGGACITSTALSAFEVEDHPNLPMGYDGYGSCTMCHGDEFDEHAEAIMDSIHWTWEATDSFTGNDVGKINIINNYCVAVPSNEPRCTSCHIGIGWTDDTFDKSNKDAIDCLICHDGTGTYAKVPTGAGVPVDGLDYQAIMQSFQAPDRDNCGKCHFYGGGGDAVKHGTLDSTMANPSRSTDVHMGGSMNMVCTDCHVPGAFTGDPAEPHTIIGSRYSQGQNDAALCQDCHTAAPHDGFMDYHATKIACQTCHVPAIARGGKATKMYWDWETAGDYIDNGDGTKSDNVIKDENGDVIYHSKKGTFVWESNVMPEYTWFNGNVVHITPDDTIVQDGVTKINVLQGSIDDANSLITPIKRFVARQPYDMGTNTLIVPHLMPTAAEKADPSTSRAYWQKYNWELAAEAGQEAIGKTYSGSGVGFTTTDMSWVANHMVAPKEDSVQCWECHNPYGRLDFAALGYGDDADHLQNLKADEAWRGYQIMEGDFVDTGDWLGLLHVANAPWVYSFDAEKFFYIPETMDAAGAWIYLMK